MTLYAGIDPGLARGGIALLDDRARIIASRYIGIAPGHERGDVQRRLDEQTNLVLPLLRRADIVVIEWPSAGGFGVGGATCPACKQKPGNAKASGLTMASAANLRGLAVGLGKTIFLPAPQTWRSALGFVKEGDDDDPDERMYEWLSRIYPATANRYGKTKRAHVLDGLALAAYGRTQTSTRRQSA